MDDKPRDVWDELQFQLDRNAALEKENAEIRKAADDTLLAAKQLMEKILAAQ